MPTPDVRVRLSAEGVAEVVSALKTVQSQAQATAAASGKSFAPLNSVLAMVKGGLAGLAAYFGGRQILQFMTDSLDAAAAAGELAQQIGTTTTKASVLSAAAQRAGVDLDGFRSMASRLSKGIDDLRQGVPAAGALFRRLGKDVGPETFRGKDTADVLELISQRIAKVPDPMTRTALAVAFLGRSGAQMIPVIDELGTKGLPEMTDAARKAGLVFDDDVAVAARSLKDDFTLLHRQVMVLGAQFISGLAPDLNQALQMIGGDLSANKGAWKDWGTSIGDVIRPLAVLLGDLADVVIGMTDTLITGLKQAYVHAKMIDDVSQLMQQGRVLEVPAVVKTYTDEWEKLGRESDARDAARAARVAARWKMINEVPEREWPKVNLPTIDTGEDPNAIAEAKLRALLAYKQAELQNETDLVKAQMGLQTEIEKERFDKGLKNVTAFYADRRKFLKRAGDLEISDLLQQRALALQEPDATKRDSDVQKIDAQIAKAKIANQLQILQLGIEERKAVKDLADKKLATGKEILELQGKQHDAAMADLKAELQAKTIELENTPGMSEEERQRILMNLDLTKRAKIAFDDATAKADAAMSDLSRARGDIENQVKQGTLTELQGQQQIAALEKDRLPTLIEIAGQLLAAAETTGDPQAIQKALDWQASLGALSVTVDELSQKLLHLSENLRSAITGDLGDWISSLGDVKNKTRNVGQAFQDLALSIAASVRKIIAEVIALKIVKGIMGLFGPPAATIADVGISLMGHAGGGLIRGPGTGISDSILARVSNREFITRAAITQQPGALEFLQEFNRYGMAAIKPIHPSLPRFAEGGLVRTPGSSPIAVRDGRISVELSEGLVLKHLDSPEGHNLVLRIAAKNRHAFKSLIG